MSLKLDWTAFRRLIQLEVLLLLALIITVIGDFFIFDGFDEAFEALAIEQGYRKGPDTLVITVMAVLGVAHLTGLFGMLRGKKLARDLYLWTFVLGWPLSWLAFSPVSWLSASTDLASSLGAMISGAILILAYSRDHGQIWFNAEVKDAR